VRRQPDATIEWGAARSFFQVIDPLSSLGVGRPRHTLFALDSGDQLIAWTVAPRATEEQRTANDRLCRLIAERTRLPLRDLAKCAEELTNSRIMGELARGVIALNAVPMNLAARRRAEFVARVSGHGAGTERSSWLGQARALIASGRAAYEVAAGHEVPRAGGKARVKAPWWRRALFVVSAVMVVSLFPGSWVLHQGEVWYYGRFANQIEASTPLYVDSLTRDDGQWYTRPMTSQDSGFTFTGSTYLIQSDARGDGGQAYAPGTYSDIAVEVTVRERPTNWNTTMGSLNTAGAAVHDTDGSTVRCGAGPIGTWFLMRYSTSLSYDAQWSVLAFGQVNHDVHWGLGVANTFLLVARGKHYWCFANGHLLGFATDSVALQPGHVGVYLDDNTIVAAFNDFRVYAVPAGM
jgi:hypothetical protein